MIDQIELELGRKLTKTEKYALAYAKHCTRKDICGQILVPIAHGERCVRVMKGEIVLTDGQATQFRATRWNWSAESHRAS